MADVNVRSDSVDVEDIMRQIRARIREKRGADYTEAELQELARVKLGKFLDPRGVRSELIAEFQAQRAAAPLLTNYEFGEGTLYETHRGPLHALRRFLRPVLKLFFNPDRLTTALHLQSSLNAQFIALHQREPLTYELLHNLTVEITRLGIEVQNLKMRVESLSSRVDFDERRARALEGVVQYRRPPRQPGPPADQDAGPPAGQGPAPAPQRSGAPAAPLPPPGEGAGERRRRRRRRRRRPGQTMADTQQGGWGNRNHAPSDEAGASDATDVNDSPDGPFDPEGPDGSDDHGQ
jgi:hypothetical protein